MLILVAGLTWTGVGIMLLHIAFTWLLEAPRLNYFEYVGAGIIIAFTVSHFILIKLADRNISRIRSLEGRQCIFFFITWKSYAIIGLMIAMGRLLRHSSIPKHHMAVVYTGMGLALVLSSVRYMRTFISEIGNGASH